MDAIDGLANLALFLDVDGTLVDIASTPDGVTIPGGLACLVKDVSRSLDGARAIVTGRADFAGPGEVRACLASLIAKRPR